jgi:formate dehydrogenase iron-sulfur subunit
VSARVYISRDSGALCVGAEEVAAAFRKAFDNRGLDVEIVRTGSRGLYWLEPLVEVATPQGRVGYGPVRVADVDDLLDAGMLDGGKHKLGLGLVEDIPWLKSQTRLTFARCGIVDPRSLEDYKAHKGYKGLEKAVAVGPEATVEEVVTSGLRGRGGAGFPTGIKWRTVAQTPPQQKYIVCNAD